MCDLTEGVKVPVDLQVLLVDRHSRYRPTDTQFNARKSRHTASVCIVVEVVDEVVSCCRQCDSFRGRRTDSQDDDP